MRSLQALGAGAADIKGYFARAPERCNTNMFVPNPDSGTAIFGQSQWH